MWWNNVVDWVSSSAGERILLGAVIPFVAIVIGAVIASIIARGSIKRLLRSRDREAKAAAVAIIVDAARQASTWNSLTPQEQAIADRTASTADITLRLLPIAGAATAANWAGHEIRQFKRASATYSVQFDGPLAEFRDRLLDWQQHPRRARKIFESDLSRWDSELAREDRELQAQQDAWVAQQHAERFTPTAAAPPAPSPSSTATPSTPASAPAAQPIAPATRTVAVQPSTASPADQKAPAFARPSDEARSSAPGAVEAPSDSASYTPVSASASRARSTVE
ncbi:MAG: hypothetical protein ABWZ77_07200 [Naasia sp.]